MHRYPAYIPDNVRRLSDRLKLMYERTIKLTGKLQEYDNASKYINEQTKNNI